MQHRFEKKIKCLVFLIVLFIFSAESMEEESRISPWLFTKSVSPPENIGVTILDRTGRIAFVGARSLAKLVALDSGSSSGGPVYYPASPEYSKGRLVYEGNKKNEFILPYISSGVKLGAFNPKKNELAVTTEKSIVFYKYAYNPESGFKCRAHLDIHHHGHADWIRYNNTGTQLAIISERGLIRVMDIASQTCTHKANLKTPVYSAQFLPEGMFSAEQLLLGCYGSVVYRSPSDECHYSLEEFAAPVIAYFDKTTGTLNEVIARGDLSLLLTVAPETHEVIDDVIFDRCTAGLVENPMRGDILRMIKTSFGTTITDLDGNHIAQIPKEVIHVLLSMDGKTLLTLLKGERNILFWENKK